MTKFYRYLFTRSELRGILILSFGIILIRLLAFAIIPVGKAGEGSGVAEAASDTSGQARQGLQKRRLVEINSADSLALIGLPGIGPVFARRIIRYRQMLGGFAVPVQLMEVFGMDSVRYAGFAGMVRLDTTVLRKLDLNKATFKELLAHPYLDYEQVKAIARFRDRKGTIGSPGELWAAGVLPDSLRQGLSHYLVALPDSSSKEATIFVK